MPIRLALLAVAVGIAQPAPKIVAALVPNGSYRVQGTLTLEPGRRDGETRARISLLTAPADARLGWVIRKGQCGERGDEVGPIAAYRVLQTRGDGSVELAVTLPIPLPRGGAYHVDVLQEPRSDVVLACGGLAEEGST